MASGDGNSVSAAWAQVVARELRKAGVDLESALCEAGLEARTINNEDAWIPYTRHAALLEIAARRYCDEVLSRQKRRKPELLQKLERRIAELLPSGQARNKIVATDLGLSERTLTRRLSDLDTSFADVVNRLRHELALRYLNEPNLSLTQVSFLLGYAGQSAFSTAFRRWTGRTPKEIRQG